MSKQPEPHSILIHPERGEFLAVWDVHWAGDNIHVSDVAASGIGARTFSTCFAPQTGFLRVKPVDVQWGPTADQMRGKRGTEPWQPPKTEHKSWAELQKQGWVIYNPDTVYFVDCFANRREEAQNAELDEMPVVNEDEEFSV
jgi:hypothetical protein